MLFQPNTISPEKLVSAIVDENYRTAEVFRKHEISYCCGGRQPLQMACEQRGIETGKLAAELGHSTRVINISPSIDFASWDPIFLMDYIAHVHHGYLRGNLGQLQSLLGEFVAAHNKRYPYLKQIETLFTELVIELRSSMFSEEQEIFPYIRQLCHAWQHREPYGGLFIRTLRKPIEDMLMHTHDTVSMIILAVRRLTNAYDPPQAACINHKVVLARLKELDADLVQHYWLEKECLFPKVSMMEKELLAEPAAL